MKKHFMILTILVLSGLVIGAPSAHAQMGSMMGPGGSRQEEESSSHTESVDVVLQSILASQGVTTVEELDMTAISDIQWEELGDAVMELYHPGDAHEAMDRMMGGEGSDALEQMHIGMGKSYLGYDENNDSMMGRGHMGMMSGGMMGRANTYGSMMGYGGFSVLHGTGALITWLALMSFLVSGTYFFIKRANKK